ncbi:MAG: YegS/Rv2252/BmrU family lipid kinase [Prevotella sp.]|nr:YegS/Rv2252/BmrU family lipid kinase [Prevotella sp.]
MNRKDSITFIINPISGTSNKNKIPSIIEEVIDKERFDYKIAYTEYAGHAFDIATKEKLAGTNVVVAVGGDGTVNEVGAALVEGQTALAIIPCGSGNGLARHLMIPMDTRGALEIINQMEIHDLDYGIINKHPFFCTCGMGFDAFISMKFAEAGKRGIATYVENVLREGLKYKPETYVLEDEDGTTTHQAFLVSCANASQYGNNAYIAPQASMSDGWLDVIIMEPFDVLEAPQVAIEMMSKTLDRNQKIKTFRTKHICIHRHQPGFIHYDGDPVMSGKDVDIRLVHSGIRVVINANADKSKRKPNMMQMALCEFFNDINIVREDITKQIDQMLGDITKQSRNIQAMNKKILRKLNKR